MAKKFDLPNMINEESSESDPSILISVNKSEISKLTKEAKSWEFTCSFCFKRFPSAQALGGHQNAHRGQRLEEKRLFVRDPITYRKRAYLRAVKAKTIVNVENDHTSAIPGPNHAHAASEPKLRCVNRSVAPEAVQFKRGDDSVKASVSPPPPPPLVLINFFPATSVVHTARNAQVKACSGLDVTPAGINLDLTLKL